MFEPNIPSILATVATAGVLVGVVLTVLELGHLFKTRQTDISITGSNTFTMKCGKESRGELGMVDAQTVSDVRDEGGKRFGP
jgi:hypothetical protein